MLVIENLTVGVGDFLIDNFNLTVERGNYFVLLGKSGSGKSTLLETIAGFRKPVKGKIFLNGEEITVLPPERRGIAVVYQDYLLFPHMNTYENLAFSLRKKIKDRFAVRKEIDRIAEELEITHLLDKPVYLLSGGEKQRVAIARALLAKPKLLLLDEPLSALDSTLKPKLRKLLKRTVKRYGTTTVHVTHDFTDAENLADAVGLMLNGKLLERGTFEEVFFSPSTIEGARFLGVNALNVRNWKKNPDGSFTVEIRGGTLKVEKLSVVDPKGYLLFRPEAVGLDNGGTEADILERERENFWETLAVRVGGCTFKVKRPFGEIPKGAKRVKLLITRAVLKELKDFRGV